MGKTAIIIVGPTAVGKTDFAVALAQRLGTEIVSADSRQCYRELRIGVARPSDRQLQAVRHHFIASHGIHEGFHAAAFESAALEAASRIFADRDRLVVVGGTGLYIDAFAKGIDAMPEVPAHVRQEVEALHALQGVGGLSEALQREDPLYAATGEMRNPHRMIRALSFLRHTGASIRTYQNGRAKPREFQVLRIGLDMPRDQLYDRIGLRVDGMMREGLEEEVASLQPCRHLPALQTVGYRELFAYMDGACGRGEAVERIRQHTRNYAKRQLTWFRRDADTLWLDARDPDKALEAAMERMPGGGG